MLRRFSRGSSLVVAVLLLLFLPARAQPGDEIDARIVGFSGWAAPDRALSLAVEVTNRGATPLTDVAVRLTIRDRVRSRSALRASLDGNPTQQGVLAVTTEELDQPIVPGGKATITVDRDLGSLATSFRSGRALNAVYPLGIAVLTGNRRLADRSGAFAFIASVPTSPLNLVWVMPIHRPLASDARGVYPKAAIERELAPAGRIRAIADLLATHAGAPITLAPTGAFADQLLDLSNGFHARDARGVQRLPPANPLALTAADLLSRLKAAMGSQAFEVATTTYGRAAITSLVSGKLASDAERQVAAGRTRVTAVLGRTPNPSLFADGRYLVDTRSARTFAALGAKTVILDPAALRNPVAGRFGPERIEDVRASSVSLDALVVDGAIRDRLELPTQDPVLRAMGVIAETAAMYLELPALGAGRMLVMATASMPEPSVAAPLLGVLAQAPWVRLRTASSVVGDPALRPSGETQRLNATPAVLSSRFAQARAARRAVDTLRRVVVPPSGAEEIDRIDRAILISESADYEQSQGTASGLARAARERAQRRLAQISVPPRRVTLTSRGGQVPVTVVNTTGYSIRVRVRLDSQKVTFPTGASRMITVPGRDRGSTFGTLAFQLEARAAGSFPVAVRLETREGDLVGTGQIQVSSSAVSAFTFMATAGGLLFLAGAWARRALSRRPKRGVGA